MRGRCRRLAIRLMALFLCIVCCSNKALGANVDWRAAENYPVSVAGASNAYLEVLWSRENAVISLRLTIASASLREDLPDGIGVSLMFYGSAVGSSEVSFFSGEEARYEEALFDAEGFVEHFPREGMMRLILQIRLSDRKLWGETFTCDAVVLTPEGGSRAFAQKPMVLVLPTTTKPTTTKPPRTTSAARQRTTKAKTTKRATTRKSKAAVSPKAKLKTTREGAVGGTLFVKETEPVKKNQVKYLIGFTAILLLLSLCYVLITHSKRAKKKEDCDSL